MKLHNIYKTNATQKLNASLLKVSQTNYFVLFLLFSFEQLKKEHNIRASLTGISNRNNGKFVCLRD